MSISEKKKRIFYPKNNIKEVKTTMTSQVNPHLCIVSWNIRGLKKFRNRNRGGVLNFLQILNKLEADIVFLQETHVGPNCCQIFEHFQGWRVYFTVHNSRSKGVAILIRDTVQFEYICHDEDCSGGYIVLSCYLYGELYTLVNVYNHHQDRIVLNRLRDYLMENTKGVLVVGGDFNTVLDPRIDRRPASSRISPLTAVLRHFTTSLNIIDTWSTIHPGTVTEQRFTWEQAGRSSRIDMFFLRENIIDERVLGITVAKDLVQNQKFSDHYPLVLKIKRQTEKTHANNRELFEDFPDVRPGKISGGEIISALMSLHERGDISDVSDYRTTCCTLKTMYNNILMTLEVPENFRDLGDSFNPEYLIFSEILAKRLLLCISHDHNNIYGTVDSNIPQNIRWSYLQIAFEKLDHDYKRKGSTLSSFAPLPDFRILDRLLPEVQNTSGDLRDLHPGCPLTNAILSLALEQLNKMFYTTDNRTRKYKKDGLPSHAQLHKHKQLVRQQFQVDSGLKLVHI